MFPKLSEKAYAEIDRRVWDNTAELGVDAFMDLFDLKKYPITWDMMFEYCKTIKSDRIETCKGCVMFFYYDEGECCCKSFYERSDMEEMLDFIVAWFGSFKKEHIHVIGEIHGWWEKGDQNAKA